MVVIGLDFVAMLDADRAQGFSVGDGEWFDATR